jgi:Zn-dependent membrane protease YugP
MLHARSMSYLKGLISRIDIDLKIRHNKTGPQGCYYDPTKKLIHLNCYNVYRRTLVALLLHEYAHRLQDRSGYFDDDMILD